jgi:hypothetical protein
MTPSLTRTRRCQPARPVLGASIRVTDKTSAYLLSYGASQDWYDLRKGYDAGRQGGADSSYGGRIKAPNPEDEHPHAIQRLHRAAQQAGSHIN